MANELSFSRLQAQAKEWQERNFKRTPSYRLLLGIAEEVGELCHAHLKAEQGIRGCEREHFEAKIDAVGDIVIFLANYCSAEGIDLESAVSSTWRRVRGRDWRRNKRDGGEGEGGTSRRRGLPTPPEG